MTNGVSFTLRGVGVRFGDDAALRDLDLDVAAGERIALVGASGAGKTTLLRLMQAGLRPSRGTVALDGRALPDRSGAEIRQLRARLGAIPQDHRLVPNLRVHQNVATGRLGRLGFWRGLREVFLPPRTRLEEIHALLEDLGIEEKLFARSDRLSGGQQQRVAIARALFQEPGALFADEPVSAVDPARAEELVRLLTDIAERRGLTLIMSLHNVELARAHFPRLVGLRAGRIVFDRPSGGLSDGDFESLYELEPTRG